jgi:hypothetical protein
MNAVIQVLRSLYEQILQVSSSEYTTDHMKVIREKGAHADVRVLTWTISNMCRGGFKTKELWQLVGLFVKGKRQTPVYAFSNVGIQLNSIYPLLKYFLK